MDNKRYIFDYLTAIGNNPGRYEIRSVKNKHLYKNVDKNWEVVSFEIKYSVLNEWTTIVLLVDDTDNQKQEQFHRQ